MGLASSSAARTGRDRPPTATGHVASRVAGRSSPETATDGGRCRRGVERRGSLRGLALGSYPGRACGSSTHPSRQSFRPSAAAAWGGDHLAVSFGRWRRGRSGSESECEAGHGWNGRPRGRGLERRRRIREQRGRLERRQRLGRIRRLRRGPEWLRWRSRRLRWLRWLRWRSEWQRGWERIGRSAGLRIGRLARQLTMRTSRPRHGSRVAGTGFQEPARALHPLPPGSTRLTPVSST